MEDLGHLTGTDSCSASCAGDGDGSLGFPNIVDFDLDSFDAGLVAITYSSNSPSADLDFPQFDCSSPSELAVNSDGENLKLSNGRIVALTKETLLSPLDQFNSFIKERRHLDRWCASDEINAKDLRRRLQNRKHSEKNRRNRRANENLLNSQVLSLRAQKQHSSLEFTLGVADALKLAFPVAAFNTKETAAFLESVKQLADKHLALF